MPGACPDCGFPMEEGFLADRGDYDVTAAGEWIEGQPVQRRWLGMKAGLDLRGRRRIPVRALRCKGCGLLKLYARG